MNTLFLILLIGIIGFIIFEIVEHVVVPLAWILLRRKDRPASGPEAMVGRMVEVRKWEKEEGLVSVKGELWRASCEIPLSPGDKAIIRRVEGLTLAVQPMDSGNGEEYGG